MTPIWLRAVCTSRSLCVWPGLAAVPPLLVGGAQWGINPVHLRVGAVAGALWGCTFPLRRGGSVAGYRRPAVAGSILGCGACVSGAVRVRGQGWFGEAPEHPASFVVRLPALRAGGAPHCSKGRRQGGNLPFNLASSYIPVGCTLCVWFAADCVRAPRNKLLI